MALPELTVEWLLLAGCCQKNNRSQWQLTLQSVHCPLNCLPGCAAAPCPYHNNLGIMSANRPQAGIFHTSSETR
jgi:hypothetical protein